MVPGSSSRTCLQKSAISSRYKQRPICRGFSSCLSSPCRLAYTNVQRTGGYGMGTITLQRRLSLPISPRLCIHQETPPIVSLRLSTVGLNSVHGLIVGFCCWRSCFIGLRLPVHFSLNRHAQVGNRWHRRLDKRYHHCLAEGTRSRELSFSASFPVDFY